MSHVTRMNESHHTRERVDVAHTKQSCHITHVKEYGPKKNKVLLVRVRSVLQYVAVWCSMLLWGGYD